LSSTNKLLARFGEPTSFDGETDEAPAEARKGRRHGSPVHPMVGSIERHDL
jgi:hypothetical protein